MPQPDLTAVTAREANQGFAALLARVETGEGFLVTKRGRPVARILPAEPAGGVLTPEKRALLDEMFREKLDFGGAGFSREEGHAR